MSQISLEKEVKSRRTFAIISHPDAGKTTLTEKLLLYSGMVRSAGMVRAKKGGKATTSDWMAMEQERGISITASALQFPYKEWTINLLDTPGHQDFSEDTYRTLTAADCAVMVIDAAKGVEAQTLKLFKVCRMRKIPILTFINKMDLPARDPFELLQEVEQVLSITSTPMNWPIGSGKGFAGVVRCDNKQVLKFDRHADGGAQKAKMEQLALEDFAISGLAEPGDIDKLSEELELLEIAGNSFDYDKFAAGELTPVFFGSALTNFGVEPFFDDFVRLAPSPRSYLAKGSTGDDIQISPIDECFSAFVFKIQANMNPKHRDSMAFMRVVSGKFDRDMMVKHHRSGKEIRMSRSYIMVAQDRETINSAYPGDVVGIINPGMLAIGDTLSNSGKFDFSTLPRFAPEIFAQIRPKDVMKKKSFDKGLQQLSDEGAILPLRSFNNPDGGFSIVAAVGKLQFDVLQFRLKNEYGVDLIMEPMPYSMSSWLSGDPKKLKTSSGLFLAEDHAGRILALFGGEWEKRYVSDKNPEHLFLDSIS